MNVVVKFLNVHYDCRTNDRSCEIGSAKGSRKLFLGENGTEIVQVCKGLGFKPCSVQLILQAL